MELTNNQQVLYRMLTGGCMEFIDNKTLTEKVVNQVAKQCASLPFVNCGASDIEKVVKLFLANNRTLVDVGVALTEKDHKPWYMVSKAKIKPVFWKRYFDYLLNEKRFPLEVLDRMDKNTDEIIDLLGDPESNESFSRKGLIVGDVQSGKTASYIGIINKAADAGYRVIILLTGTIEKLRSQTQERVDLGFVGLDSNVSVLNEPNVWVGVGKYDQSKSGWCFTSKKKDFNLQTANTRGLLKSITDPVVFVLKKNKSVLTWLCKWLSQNKGASGTISLPMLLIDDESDNASVNTKKNLEETTAINGCIRDFLVLFSKSNYVGFTATPYANIFIDPDTDDAMRKEDLFPRHFIYILPSPSNYIGPMGIFAGRPDDFDEDFGPANERGKFGFMLRNNDDCEDSIPLSHRKNFEIEDLPESLEEAVISFFIANTIRDIRGDVTSHRTMLVNVSRFIAVQNSLQQEVDSLVRRYARVIENYSNMPTDTALRHEEFRRIKEVFDKDYSQLPDDGFATRKTYSWEEIQQNLWSSVSSIIVRSVNGGNATKELDYEAYTGKGLRLIAIGGLSLSRGLTLEGLVISYYYRNTKMYDTLMQMGRWFGYRDGYADLCRLWMSKDSQDWYNYIANATEELKKSVRLMRDIGKTPEDFGLKVRSDKASLLVTSKSKMRTASDYTVLISLSQAVEDTKYVFTKHDIVEKNFNTTSCWISDLLEKKGYSFWSEPNKALANPNQIKNVDYQEIISFLSSFECSKLNLTFDIETLAKLVYDSRLLTPKWDILIAKGKGGLTTLGGVTVRKVQRKFAEKSNGEVAQVSGAAAHLLSRTDFKCGLTLDQEKQIEIIAKRLRDEGKDKDSALNQGEYFVKTNPRRNPVLIIYPLELDKIAVKKGENPPPFPEKITHVNNSQMAFIGLGFGYPKVDEKDEVKAEYRINKRFAQSLEVDDIDDSFEERGVDE